MYATLILSWVSLILDILVIQLLIIFVLYHILKTMIPITIKDYSKSIKFDSLVSHSIFIKTILQQFQLLSDQQKIIITTTSVFLAFIRIVTLLPNCIDIIATQTKNIPFFKYINYINNTGFLLVIEFIRTVCIIVFVLYIIIKSISQ